MLWERSALGALLLEAFRVFTLSLHAVEGPEKLGSVGPKRTLWRKGGRRHLLLVARMLLVAMLGALSSVHAPSG